MWQNDRENWQFKSIANDEAARICLNRALMPKRSFDIYVEFLKTNKSYGMYKRLMYFCDEVEAEYNRNKNDEEVRNRMKRVLRIRRAAKDPREG